MTLADLKSLGPLALLRLQEEADSRVLDMNTPSADFSWWINLRNLVRVEMIVRSSHPLAFAQQETNTCA